MKQNAILTITSLVSILLTTFHHSDDVVRGMAPAGLNGNLVPVIFLLVWLYGTLMLAERRSGYVINLIASLLASGLPLVHMIGSGLAGKRIGSAEGAFFFAWTLIALGVTANFCVILSVCGLWRLRQGQAR